MGDSWKTAWRVNFYPTFKARFTSTAYQLSLPGFFFDYAMTYRGIRKKAKRYGIVLPKKCPDLKWNMITGNSFIVAEGNLDKPASV